MLTWGSISCKAQRKIFVMPETRDHKLVQFSVRESSLTWCEYIEWYKLSIMSGESKEHQHNIYITKILQ